MNTARDLGMFSDNDLSFDIHICRVTRTAFYHKKVSKFRKIENITKVTLRNRFMQFISHKIDCCNVLFAGLSKLSLGQPHLVQNMAATVLTCTWKLKHMTTVFKSITGSQLNTELALQSFY